MKIKVLSTLSLLMVLTVVNTVALPRDSSVVKSDSVLKINDDSSSTVPKDISGVPSGNGVQVPGRISCRYEEITEDPVCLDHCFPKGYKYGLCVGRVCSCM